MNKNIPALFLAGMFFFSAWAFGGELSLATDLFEQHDWALCRRECRRALLAGKPPKEKFQLLEAMASVRIGEEPEAVLERFEAIIATNADEQVSAIAAYELGRVQWRLDQTEAALGSFETAFNTTTNKALFLRAGCSIFQLFKEHSGLKNGRSDLIQQINTSRDQWYGALFAETARPDPKKNQPKAPNWIVRFYRAQISPAIGNRCVLEPSCSEYFHQAQQAHGLKSIPMIADRFFREPDVSNQKKEPVVMPDGRIRYRDPIQNHDFWMKK